MKGCLIQKQIAGSKLAIGASAMDSTPMCKLSGADVIHIILLPSK
jgi:hypothetical protein